MAVPMLRRLGCRFKSSTPSELVRQTSGSAKSSEVYESRTFGFNFCRRHTFHQDDDRPIYGSVEPPGDAVLAGLCSRPSPVKIVDVTTSCRDDSSPTSARSVSNKVKISPSSNRPSVTQIVVSNATSTNSLTSKSVSENVESSSRLISDFLNPSTTSAATAGKLEEEIEGVAQLTTPSDTQSPQSITSDASTTSPNLESTSAGGRNLRVRNTSETRKIASASLDADASLGSVVRKMPALPSTISYSSKMTSSSNGMDDDDNLKKLLLSSSSSLKGEVAASIALDEVNDGGDSARRSSLIDPLTPRRRAALKKTTRFAEPTEELTLEPWALDSEEAVLPSFPSANMMLSSSDSTQDLLPSGPSDLLELCQGEFLGSCFEKSYSVEGTSPPSCTYHSPSQMSSSPSALKLSTKASQQKSPDTEKSVSRRSHSVTFAMNDVVTEIETTTTGGGVKSRLTAADLKKIDDAAECEYAYSASNLSTVSSRSRKSAASMRKVIEMQWKVENGLADSREFLKVLKSDNRAPMPRRSSNATTQTQQQL